MIRNRLGRYATVLATAVLATALLGVGTVSAANPSWDVSFDRLPNVVAPGNDAGWFVTVINKGPSNINDLHVTITSEVPGDLPTYLSDLTLSSGGPWSCSTATGAEVCSVGTVVAGGTVTFTVAFAVPSDATGAFDLNIGLVAGTGDTGSDTPGKSRGDKKTFTDSTPISQSSNFDGGFVVGSDTFSTNQNVGRRNVQATTLEGADSLVGVTIEDGITSGVECSTSTDLQCGRLFGEWSHVNVDDGATFDSAFKVTLLVSGSAVPGGTSASDIVVVHVLDDGTIDVIGDTSDEICDSATAPTNPECMLATKNGNNYLIVVWLFQNGNLRGGY